MSSIWHSLRASVYVLFEEFHIFYMKVGVHAQVRTGNVDILPTSSMAGFMAAQRVKRGIFRALSVRTEVERHFSELSVAKSSAFVDIEHSA